MDKSKICTALYEKDYKNENNFQNRKCSRNGFKQIRKKIDFLSVVVHEEFENFLSLFASIEFGIIIFMFANGYILECIKGLNSHIVTENFITANTDISKFFIFVIALMVLFISLNEAFYMLKDQINEIREAFIRNKNKPNNNKI